MQEGPRWKMRKKVESYQKTSQWFGGRMGLTRHQDTFFLTLLANPTI